MVKGDRPHDPVRAPRLHRRWGLREADGAAELAEAVGLPELQARLLAGRGVRDPALARLWVGGSLADLPDPRAMVGMDAAVERVLRALRGGERVAVHGDYDVDGTTATALLVGLLRDLGGDVLWYAPHRQRDGYGVALHTVDRLAEGGARLMITCDTGVSAHAAIARAAERGMDTVVCDHHQLPPVLPDCAAILNPRQDGEDSPFAELAAVGVAFMLAVALRARLRDDGAFADRPEPDLREVLDLVALGTVADLAPLRGVNRLLVTAGLRVLERRRRPGLRALLSVSGVKDGDPLTASHLGFRLGPRINAAGRLDEAARAVELMLAGDDATATERAGALDDFNRQRQQTERDILDDALRQVLAIPDLEQRRGLVLWSDRWHPGVVGIVAARIVSTFHRPAVVVAVRDGVGTGSGRTIPDVDLYAALQGCDALLDRWGGHRAAAGLTVTEANLPALADAFAGPAFAEADEGCWTPRLRADAELPLREATWGTWDAVQALAPFGVGNPEPVFLARGLRATGVQELSKGGIRMRLRQDDSTPVAAVGFGLGVQAHDLVGPLEAAFCLSENRYRGERSLELRLRDLRPQREGRSAGETR